MRVTDLASEAVVAAIAIDPRHLEQRHAVLLATAADADPRLGFVLGALHGLTAIDVLKTALGSGLLGSPAIRASVPHA
jgi:hypothetical protein